VRAPLAALVVLGSCTPRPAPVPAAVSPFQIEEPVTATMVAAFDADCRGEPADSLWDPEATVIADGALRDGPPRFAGVGLGGQVAITTSRLDLRQSLAWLYLEYRWSALNAGLVREARATVLLSPGVAGRWRIVHAHSSSAGGRM
jgi:hypothetical protein